MHQDPVDVYYIQVLQTLARQAGDPQQKWREYQEDWVAEAESATFWARLQPRTSGYDRLSRQFGRWLIAAGQRLESRAAEGTITSVAETTSP